MQVYQRILSPPRQSFFLLGPRGTGKSTWVGAAFPAARRIDLLDEATYQSYLTEPALFGAELNAVPRGGWVVIDEVQRLPSLLNEVQRAIEGRGHRFALLGSSARKLKQHGTNLLAGRALRRDLHAFVPEELGDDFALDRALAWGTVPVVWSAESPKETLAAYARMYLREEIQAEALVRNLPGFARFLGVAALMHGQVINVSGLARDAAVARTTVEGHLDILEDTLVAFRLPGYEPRLRVRERKHPKLYLFDPGVARALKGQLTPRPAAEEMGALFEGWVASLLRAYRDYHELFDEWWYWSPTEARATEVDFVLRRGRSFLAIETRAARRWSTADLTGLRAIGELGGLVRRVLVCRAERRARTSEGIDVLPVSAFLEDLAADRLWP